MGHTPTPWKREVGYGLVGPDGDHVCTDCIALDLSRSQESKENTDRIVSAVNFCTNIPTDQLEGVTLKEVVSAVEAARTFIGIEYADAKSQALDGEYVAPEARAVWKQLCNVSAAFTPPRSSTVEPDIPTAEGEK